MPKKVREHAIHEHPQWLKEAVIAADLIQSGRNNGHPDNDIFIQILKATGRDIGSARRLIGLRQFLINEHPEFIANQSIRVGAFVVRELQLLHSVDRDAAKEIGPAVLQGAVSIRNIRSIIAKAKARATRETDSPRVASFRKGKSFAKYVISAIAAKPTLLGLSNIQKVEIPKHRTPLMPDIVLHHDDGKETAIEVKQGAPAATNAMNVAGAYLARLAQLMQRYDQAILVLPQSAKAFADCMKDLQKNWDHQEPRIVLFSDETSANGSSGH